MLSSTEKTWVEMIVVSFEKEAGIKTNFSRETVIERDHFTTVGVII